MGIGWGLFGDVQSKSNYPGGVSPHNWPAIALLYGGIISFAVAVGFHLSLVRSWVSGATRQDCKEWYKVPLALLITCVVCSWLEQAFQTPITLFTFFLALAALFAPPSEATALSSIGQPIRPSLLRFPPLSGRGSRRTFRTAGRANRKGFAVGKREPHGAGSLLAALSPRRVLSAANPSPAVRRCIGSPRQLNHQNDTSALPSGPSLRPRTARRSWQPVLRVRWWLAGKPAVHRPSVAIRFALQPFSTPSLAHRFHIPPRSPK
jgi:hypothetical protein